MNHPNAHTTVTTQETARGPLELPWNPAGLAGCWIAQNGATCGWRNCGLPRPWPRSPARRTRAAAKQEHSANLYELTVSASRASRGTYRNHLTWPRHAGAGKEGAGARNTPSMQRRRVSWYRANTSIAKDEPAILARWPHARPWVI
jgi:hypothetical protein